VFQNAEVHSKTLKRIPERFETLKRRFSGRSSVLKRRSGMFQNVLKRWNGPITPERFKTFWNVTSAFRLKRAT